ncbi:peptidylprolyl isomerase [Pasteurellaceae bacterium 15-036681]|nr:peptidylprolyl isomerase [Pasteurellaceae bacterium 15-036681]
MLKTKLSAIAVLASSLFIAQSALAEKADTKFIDDSSYAVGVLMGKNIEGIVESQKEIFTYNQDKIIAGVKDTIKKSGKLTDEDLQKQLKALDNYLVAQETKIQAEKSKETVSAGDKFRAEYAKQSDVKKTESGLLYKIEKAGEGESPKATDTVKVHYKGTLPDGTVFDSSYDRGEPIEFQLNQLIPAWIEAIPMLKKGGKMEIVLPPELGYGDRQAGKIPANSTLKFEIELLDFKN